MAPESLTLYLFPMRSQFILAAALMAASPLSRAFAASVDVAPFRLFDRGLNPEAGISYFDHEGNSPFKGEARSKMTFSPDNLHFTFDVKSVDGAYSGWYIAAREKTISFEDKSVLRFEMKGTKNIPTDQFQIGIRTANLPAETNGAKIMLSELGYDRFPTAYTMIEIPVSLLYEREPNLDLKRAVHLLIFGIVEPTKDIVKAEVWMIFHLLLGLVLAVVMIYVGTATGAVLNPIDTLTNLTVSPSNWMDTNLLCTLWDLARAVFEPLFQILWWSPGYRLETVVVGLMIFLFAGAAGKKEV